MRIKEFALLARLNHLAFLYAEMADIAREEGYSMLSVFLTDLMKKKFRHAHLLLSSRLTNDLQAEISFQLHSTGQTRENLVLAGNIENHLWTEVLPEVKKEADKANDSIFAQKIEQLSYVSSETEQRILMELHLLEGNLPGADKDDMIWECSSCGYYFEQDEKPEKCPLCNAAQGFFRQIIE